MDQPEYTHSLPIDQEYFESLLEELNEKAEHTPKSLNTLGFVLSQKFKFSGKLTDIHRGSLTLKRFCVLISKPWPRPFWSGLFCDGSWKSPFMRVRVHLGVETQRQWSESSYLAHHSCTARSFFSGHSLCSSIAPGSVFACSSGGLVYQNASHIFRHAGFCSSASLASDTFLLVTGQSRYDGNSARSLRVLHPNARLRGIIWIKSSLSLRRKVTGKQAGFIDTIKDATVILEDRSDS
jgi:hypothetical protein